MPFLLILTTTKNTTMKKPYKRSKHRRRHAAGFTLVEIMIVLFIMVLIAAVGVGSFRAALSSSRVKTTDLYVNDTLANAIKQFELNVGRFPATLGDLLVCPSDVSPAKWIEPYLDDRADDTDPWGNLYQYVTPGQRSNTGFDVWSSGPDGENGTADDIGNWRKAE